MYETIIAGLVLGLLGIVYRILKTKIETMEQNMVLSDACVDRHRHIDNDLAKGDKKFEKILEAQQKMVETLGRIDERVKIMSEGNKT